MTVGPVPSPTSSFPEQPILVRPLPDPSAMTRTPTDPAEKRPPNIKLQYKAAKERSRAQYLAQRLNNDT
jgi:hypothetical protein